MFTAGPISSKSDRLLQRTSGLSSLPLTYLAQEHKLTPASFRLRLIYWSGFSVGVGGVVSMTSTGNGSDIAEWQFWEMNKIHSYPSIIQDKMLSNSNSKWHNYFFLFERHLKVIISTLMYTMPCNPRKHCKFLLLGHTRWSWYILNVFFWVI